MSESILDKAKKIYDILSEDDASKGQAEHVARLIEKLENDDITVSIIGQFKRGKSSLANRILGDDVLPVGIIPITSAVTKVVHGERSAEVHFMNGLVEPVEFENLSEYISEQENADNVRGVESVILRTPSDFLREGLTFVDTPGVGSFHKNNTETAYHYLKESDAVIFLLSVDSPINQIEIDFLQNTKEFAGKFYFAVNKTDTVSEDDLNAYVGYCRKLLCSLMNTDDIKLFPVSAKTGAGVEELKATILSDCKTSVKEILEQSTEKKLKDAVLSSIKQLNFYWKAMNMDYNELDERFEAVETCVNEIKEDAENCDGLYEFKLNEYRHKLSAKILELFEMEYHYHIEELPAGIIRMEKEDFLKQVDALCKDLTGNLSGILLYREENAYVVYKRCYKINRITDKLRRIRDKMNAEAAEKEAAK